VLAQDENQGPEFHEHEIAQDENPGPEFHEFHSGMPEMSRTGFDWLQFVPQPPFLLKDFSPHWGLKTPEPA
jgi:hypothetical protein